MFKTNFKYLFYNLKSKLINRRKIFNKLCLTDNLNPDELRLSLNKSVLDELEINGNKSYKLYNNLLPAFYNLPINKRDKIEVKNFEVKTDVNGYFSGWFVNNIFKTKQPIAYIKAISEFQLVRLCEIKTLDSVHVFKATTDGGKFNTNTKLIIYRDQKENCTGYNSNVLCEINIIDNYENGYKPEGTYIKQINDFSTTGIFDVYFGTNNKTRYNFFQEDIEWFTITLVSKKKKNTTTIDWLYLIQETLPALKINIDENSYINRIETGVEVYNVTGIFKLNLFHTRLKIKNYE